MPAVQVPARFNAASFFLDRHLDEGRGGRTAFRHAGRNVVGACLVEHGTVLEAAVVGGEDDDGEHVKQRLTGYKAPRWIEFVDDPPKTSTGKIQRFRLRAAN